MLVSAKEMLDKAVAGHYAVGQFNINNLEWTKSILLTAFGAGFAWGAIYVKWGYDGRKK